MTYHTHSLRMLHVDGLSTLSTQRSPHGGAIGCVGASARVDRVEENGSCGVSGYATAFRRVTDFASTMDLF